MKKRMTSPEAPPTGVIQEVALESVIPPSLPVREKMSDQAMQDLKESLASVGQLYPLLVKRAGEFLEVVDGHRRFLAARELGWRTLRAVVFGEADAPGLAVMIHANFVREEVNAAEEAVFMQQVREKLGLDEAGLCAAFCCTPAYLGERFKLLRGDEGVFEAVRSGAISMSAAHVLNGCEDEDMRRYFLDAAVRGGHSARMLAKWVADWRANGGSSAPGGSPVDQPGAGEAVAGSEPEGQSGVVRDGLASAAGSPSHVVECVFCGGHKDPYNMVNVWVHKWELDAVLKAAREVAEGVK